MARWRSVLSISLPVLALALGQERQKLGPPKADPPKAEQAQQEREPPEEDEGTKEKEYSFNPLQAAKELQTGNYYFKKGSFKAAANRFREASRWDPTSAEAFVRLGDAQEKLKDKKAAHEAYAKFLELDPDSKRAVEIRRKIGGKPSK